MVVVFPCPHSAVVSHSSRRRRVNIQSAASQDQQRRDGRLISSPRLLGQSHELRISQSVGLLDIRSSRASITGGTTTSTSGEPPPLCTHRRRELQSNQRPVTARTDNDPWRKINTRRGGDEPRLDSSTSSESRSLSSTEKRELPVNPHPPPSSSSPDALGGRSNEPRATTANRWIVCGPKLASSSSSSSWTCPSVVQFPM